MLTTQARAEVIIEKAEGSVNYDWIPWDDIKKDVQYHLDAVKEKERDKWIIVTSFYCNTLNSLIGLLQTHKDPQFIQCRLICDLQSYAFKNDEITYESTQQFYEKFLKDHSLKSEEKKIKKNFTGL